MTKTLNYIREYIDEDATCEDYNEKAKSLFSIQLAGAFDYYVFKVLSECFLIIKPQEEITTSRLQGVLPTIEEKTEMDVAVTLDEVTPYALKKMLKEKMAFIIPGKQLSLPFLALHIKKERRAVRKNIKKFSPGTQQVYLYTLYGEDSDIEVEAIMKKLMLSKMTATRGLNDLLDLGLLDYDIAGQTGRKKIYHKTSPREYYSEGKKYLDNPVRETVYVKELPIDEKLVKTDLTALGELTMLAEPKQPCYALYSKNRINIESLIIDRGEALEKGLPMVQLTKYDVGILGENGYADPVSIMLGIEEKDERIEMALDELLNKYAWYEGEENW